MSSEETTTTIFIYIYTLPKTNMTMENESVEDVFPIENGGFSNFILDLRGVVVWEYKLEILVG